jgi:hypothetical protein
MKCPNCSFDIQAGSESCPFCNFMLPTEPVGGASDGPGEDDDAAEAMLPPTKTLKAPVRDAQSDGAPEGDPNDPLTQVYDDNAAGGIEAEPTPTESANPDLGAPPSAEDDSLAQAYEESKKLPVEAPQLSGDAKIAVEAEEMRRKHVRDIYTKNGLIVVAVIAIGSAGYRMGMFDDVLQIAGLKSPPPVEAVEETPVEEETPEAQTSPPAKDTEAAENTDDEVLADDEEATAPEPVKVVAEPVAKPEEWWFYGAVYDMYSLRPLSGVEIMFMGDDEVTVITDDKGQYRVKLPMLYDVIGYEVLITKRGYHESFLEDKKRNFKKLGIKARHQLITQTAKAKKPWSAAQAQWVRRDLALFPIR